MSDIAWMWGSILRRCLSGWHFVSIARSIFKRAKRERWSVPIKKGEWSIPPFFGMQSIEMGAVITTNQSFSVPTTVQGERLPLHAYRYKCHHAHVTLLSKLLIDKKLYMRTQQIKRNYWGPIRQFQVPCNIFKRDQLIVGPNALAVLLTLYETAKNRKATDKQEFASLVISQKRLIERTGYSKNVITKAVRELEAASFIRASAGDRRKYGEFGVNRYVLCDPQTSEPLRVVPGLRLLYGNAISYFNLPVCIVQESVPHWSIAKLTGSELVLYVALVYCANRKGQSELAIVPSDLRRLCHLSQPTFKKAIAELQQRGLILADETTQVLCDPYTGEPLHKFTGDSEDDPSNYYERMGDRIGKRANLNLEAEETERWILACLSPDALLFP